MDIKFRAARVWSNNELSKYAGIFMGGVVNVSGWNDDDKQGKKYKDYFVNASDYSITNYGGVRGKADDKATALNEYQIDLSKPVDMSFVNRFEVVFNHTTLEHIYENRIAFENLCLMARDAVIVVVPWVQEVHITDSFNDYWRYSPYTMEKLYEENGFSMVICSYNNEYDTAVYLFCIGIRNDRLSDYPMFHKMDVTNEYPAGNWIGRPSIWDRIVSKLKIGHLF